MVINGNKILKEIELKKILDFIELDSRARADKFASDLNDKILDTTFMPYRFGQNKIINDEKIWFSKAMWCHLLLMINL